MIRQVVLRFGLLFALVPLVTFTRRHAIMHKLVVSTVTTILASLITAVVIGLNAFLIYQVFTG